MASHPSLPIILALRQSLTRFIKILHHLHKRDKIQTNYTYDCTSVYLNHIHAVLARESFVGKTDTLHFNQWNGEKHCRANRVALLLKMYFTEQALLLITIQAIFYMVKNGDLTFASIVRACVVWNYLVIHCSPFLFKFLARSPQTRFAVQRLVNPRRKRRTTIGSYVGQRLHSFKVAPERRSVLRCTTRIIWSKLVWFFHLLDFLSIDENHKKNHNQQR